MWSLQCVSLISIIGVALLVIAWIYPEDSYEIPVELEIPDVTRLWTLPPMDKVAHEASIHGMTKEERLSHAAKVRYLVKHYNRFWEISEIPARRITVGLLADIASCLETNSCTKRQSTVVMGGSRFYGKQKLGHDEGEHIWARSTVDAFEDLGITFLFTGEPIEMREIHKALPSQFVRRIIMDGDDVEACVGQGIPHRLKKEWIRNEVAVITPRPKEIGNRTAEEEGLNGNDYSEEFGWKNLRWSKNYCVKRPGFEDGIPIWKIHTFNWWPDVAHPLGAKFVIVPEDFESFPVRRGGPQFYYLGFSIEKWCNEYRFYNQSKRLNRAYVDTKYLDHFDQGNFVFYNEGHTFEDMHNSKGIDFVAASDVGQHAFDVKGVTWLGRTNLDKFYDDVGKSNVLVGTGIPWVSASPYDALCMGTPYINPIHGWDQDHPEDRDHWYAQAEGFFDTYPPYVYHVHAHDLEGYAEAIATAMKTPIERYIMPKMTTQANLARHKHFLEGDWETLAKELIEDLPDEKRLDWERIERYLL